MHLKSTLRSDKIGLTLIINFMVTSSNRGISAAICGMFGEVLMLQGIHLFGEFAVSYFELNNNLVWGREFGLL